MLTLFQLRIYFNLICTSYRRRFYKNAVEIFEITSLLPTVFPESPGHSPLLENDARAHARFSWNLFGIEILAFSRYK